MVPAVRVSSHVEMNQSLRGLLIRVKKRKILTQSGKSFSGDPNNPRMAEGLEPISASFLG